MRQQTIARIFLGESWCRFRALAIGRAGNQFAKQRFHVPMKIVLEMKGKPVQQFRMAGFLTDTSEIFKSLDDSCAEELFPVAIHRGTRGKRLAGREEPFCKC